MILCRNVMIYFDRPLQNRVHQLFYDSLVRFGILALGHKESIRFTGVRGLATRSSTPARSSTGESDERARPRRDRRLLGRARRAAHAPRRAAGRARRGRRRSSSTALPSRIRPRSATCSAPSRALQRARGRRQGRARAGHVYVAPPDYHLLVEHGTLALSTDEPVQYAGRRSTCCFETAAEAYRERCVGVVLTGANADGARGLARDRRARRARRSSRTPRRAERDEMPRAALARGARRRASLPLDEIAPLLVELCGLAKVTAA